MKTKSVIIISAVLFIQAALSDDSGCSWTPEEAKESCCKQPEIGMDVMEQCAKELNYQWPPVQHDTIDPCGEECAYDKLGVLTDDKSKIDAEKVIQVPDSYLPNDTKWRDIIRESALDCNRFIDDFAEKEGKCKSGGWKYTQCLIRNFNLRCPESDWNNSDKCQVMKTKMEKCPDLFPYNDILTIIPKEE